MNVIITTHSGANTVRTDVVTDRTGSIEIPRLPCPIRFGPDSVHKLWGDADGQSPTFRLFRVIPERALANSRKVMGRNDKHQLMVDVLPEPDVLVISDSDNPTVPDGLEIELPEPDVFVPEDASKGELIAIAEGLGVHTVPDSMSKEDLKDAIEDATEPEPFAVEVEAVDSKGEVEVIEAKPKQKAVKKAVTKKAATKSKK